jgi:hypothetical protein
MNNKTSKLLRKYSLVTNKNYRKLKKHWVELNINERTILRSEIKIWFNLLELNKDITNV